MEIAGAIIVWLAFCVLAGFIAESRGRSPGGWFALSLVFSPLFGLIGAIALPKVERRSDRLQAWRPPPTEKQCPRCLETTEPRASICPSCQFPFPKST